MNAAAGRDTEHGDVMFACVKAGGRGTCRRAGNSRANDPRRLVVLDHVLEDHRSWNGEALREAMLDEAIAALVVGAKKTGITDLLSLVPTCPDDGSRCTRCEGERWDKPLREHGLEIIGGLCRGRGWMTPELLEAAKARGAAV